MPALQELQCLARRLALSELTLGRTPVALLRRRLERAAAPVETASPLKPL
jgi:hypothetical protein